jgi:hypothetical protein
VRSLPPLDPTAVAEAALDLEASIDGWTVGRARSRRRANPGGPLPSYKCWSELDLLDRTPLEERIMAELATKVNRGDGGLATGCSEGLGA